MQYKRLTNQKDNIGKFMSYAHGKDNEVYIYDEKGNDIPLAEYVAKHCVNNDMEVKAEDILTGDICMHCDMCTAGILNFVAIQAATLYSRLVALEDKIESGELISTKELGNTEIEFFTKHNAEVKKRAIKEFIAKFNENLVISFSLTDSVDTIADRVSECVDSCLLSTAKEYGVVLTKEG